MALAGVQAPKGTALFNVCEISRDGLAPLVVEFYCGDILELYSDILLIGLPCEEGSRILSRVGAEAAYGLPEGTFTAATRLHRLPDGISGDFREFWLLELKASHDSSPLTEAELGQRFSTLCASSPSLFRSAPQSVAMSIPRFDQDGISTQEAAAQLLRLARRWAIQSSSLSVVRAVTSDPGYAMELGSTVDALLGYGAAGSRSGLLAQVSASLSSPRLGGEPELASMLNQIFHLSQFAVPSLRSICIQSRRLAEACTERLSALYQPGRPVPQALIDRLHSLQPEISSREAWITAYLYLLATCGSKAAEQPSQKMTETEAISSVLAAQRVAQFTAAELSHATGR